jgi:hypothetical protein
MSNNMDLGTNLEGFIKTLLQRLDMPTKEDINHLHDRLDTLEQLIQQKKPGTKRQPSKRGTKRRSASATVLEMIAVIRKARISRTLSLLPDLRIKN